MKWASYLLCYLRGAVLRLSVLCSRAVSECFSRVAAKSMSWNWHEKAVQMKISLSSKLSWLKEIMGSLFLLVGVSLLLWVLVLFACASCSAPRFPKPSSFPSLMQTEKAEQNSFFGIISWPASQDPITLSSGHLAYMGQTALMGILGFYFGPSPRG